MIADTRGVAHELYDLARDPMETTNLMDTEPHQALRLQALMDTYFLQGHSRPGAAAEGRPVEDILAEREFNNTLVDQIMSRPE
ncbi:MAG: hypothetical protein LC725_03255 [Lentisphaerae bacterium]|nr:hypothetical protein [Lentisphaerota bacterium]